MWPDRVSNPGPLIYESSALLTALRGPGSQTIKNMAGTLEATLFKLNFSPKEIKRDMN